MSSLPNAPVTTDNAPTAPAKTIWRYSTSNIPWFTSIVTVAAVTILGTFIAMNNGILPMEYAAYMFLVPTIWGIIVVFGRMKAFYALITVVFLAATCALALFAKDWFFQFVAMIVD